MGGDIVVALGEATGDGSTLFGHNCSHRGHDCSGLERTIGRVHTAGEVVPTTFITLPQVRQTYTVLGDRASYGWGFTSGVNENGVTAGCIRTGTRISCEQAGLLGVDLVRLVLERSRTALQGVDVLTDLIAHYGQGGFPGCPAEADHDNAFMIADAHEAFAVEASGRFWVTQEIHQVRALGELCTIRQDWNTIARGLSSHAIDQAWWPADGTKLDFAGAVSRDNFGLVAGLKRWGRAMLLLEQQNGHIDLAYFRRLLSDHYDGCPDEVDPLDADGGPVPLCRHPKSWASAATVGSLIVQIGDCHSPVLAAWKAFGPPCLSIYFPIFTEGDLPDALTANTSAHQPCRADVLIRKLVAALGKSRDHWDVAREELSRLQSRVDSQTEEFCAQATACKERGEVAEFAHLANTLMQHHWEQFSETVNGLLHAQRSQAEIAASAGS